MKKILFLIIVCSKVLTTQTSETKVVTNEKGEKIREVKISELSTEDYNETKRLYRGSI